MSSTQINRRSFKHRIKIISAAETFLHTVWCENFSTHSSIALVCVCMRNTSKRKLFTSYYIHLHFLMNKYVLSILFCLLISVCHPHLEKSARRPTKLLRTPWVRNWKPCRQWVQLTCWCHRMSLVSSGCLELQDEWYKLELIRLIDEKKNNQEYLKRKSCERCSVLTPIGSGGSGLKAQGNEEKTKPSSTGTYSIDREKRNNSKKQPGFFGSKCSKTLPYFWGSQQYH